MRELDDFYEFVDSSIFESKIDNLPKETKQLLVDNGYDGNQVPSASNGKTIVAAETDVLLSRKPTELCAEMKTYIETLHDESHRRHQQKR